MVLLPHWIYVLCIAMQQASFVSSTVDILPLGRNKFDTLNFTTSIQQNQRRQLQQQQSRVGFYINLPKTQYRILEKITFVSNSTVGDDVNNPINKIRIRIIESSAVMNNGTNYNKTSMKNYALSYNSKETNVTVDTVTIDFNLSMISGTSNNDKAITYYNWTYLGPFRILYTKGPKELIIGKSQPFYIQNFKSILQLKDSYYPGEFLFVNNTHYDSNEDTDTSPGYYRVYSVPSSYTNEPTKFSTAPIVSDRAFIYNKPNYYPIDWTTTNTTSGKLYQLVTFYPSNQIIKGISNVFTIKPPNENTATVVKTATVTFNGTSFFPGQLVNVTVTRDGIIPAKNYIDIVVVPAELSLSQIYDNYNYLKIDNQSLLWNSSKSNTNSYSINTMFNRGRFNIEIRKFYKFVIFDRYDKGRPKVVRVLGISSKRFRIRKPIVRVLMANRTLVRFETETVEFYNPYIQYYLNQYWQPYYYGIVNRTDKSIQTIPGSILAFPDNTTRIYFDLPVGIYQFAILTDDKTKYIFDSFITNSSFQIV